MPQSRTHLPALDGLRGLAILLVLFHHFASFTGDDPGSAILRWVQKLGWLGVDLFFVLSGFLITGILLDSRDSANYYRNFYFRRILRIFPLYYVYIALFLLALAVLNLAGRGDAKETEMAMSDGFWASFYLINVKIALLGHFVHFGINHFWSLAIEEQFYFTWPFLVRALDIRRLGMLCVGTIVLAFTLRQLLPSLGVHPMANHVLVFCRADSLAVGALVAVLCRTQNGLLQRGRWLFRGLFAVGLAVLALSYDRAETVSLAGNVIYLVAAVIFMSLLVLVLGASEQSLLFRFFNLAILKRFGKLAYGLYVFNQVFAFSTFGWVVQESLKSIIPSLFVAEAVHMLLGICLTFTAAWLSWNTLEKYFLSMKSRYEY